MCITYAHGHGTRGTIGYMLGIDATALCASASKVLRGCSHRRTPALDSNLDRSENAQRECPEPEMKPGGQIHSLTPGSIIANTPCLTQHANRVKGLLSRAKRNPETLTIQLLIKLASSHLILISFSSHSHLILISFSSHSHLLYFWLPLITSYVMENSMNLSNEVTKMVRKLGKGLTADEKKILPARLKFVMASEGNTRGISFQTQERVRIAHEFMSSVLEVSAHLFFVLVILKSSTHLGLKKSNNELKYLLDPELHDGYKFSLGSDDKRFLDNIAQQKGFKSHPMFLTLMSALFPNDQSTKKGERRM
jgi:hypothetical protein